MKQLLSDFSFSLKDTRLINDYNGAYSVKMFGVVYCPNQWYNWQIKKQQVRHELPICSCGALFRNERITSLVAQNLCHVQDEVLVKD